MSHPEKDITEPFFFTKVDIFYSWPLGIRNIFAKGFKYLLFNLGESICIHDPNTQGVHPTALERHIKILQRKTVV